MTLVAPIAMIGLSIVAAGVYASCGDWRRTIYWCAASVITAAVSF